MMQSLVEWLFKTPLPTMVFMGLLLIPIWIYRSWSTKSTEQGEIYFEPFARSWISLVFVVFCIGTLAPILGMLRLSLNTKSPEVVYFTTAMLAAWLAVFVFSGRRAFRVAFSYVVVGKQGVKVASLFRRDISIQIGTLQRIEFHHMTAHIFTVNSSCPVLSVSPSHGCILPLKQLIEDLER